MEQLESERSYGVRESDFPRWHTAALVLLTGVAGWYAVYRVAIWLLELLRT